jgi:hypothetical protein
MRHWRKLEEVERVPITVVEVEPFPAEAAAVWNDEECLAFIGRWRSETRNQACVVHLEVDIWEN